MRAPSSRRGTLGVHEIGRVGLASLAPAFGALFLAVGFGGGEAEAKTPGKTYCFYGKCHRVKTVEETEALIGTEETISASHYDSCKRDRYNPCGLTSSGEEFNSEAPDNAASPIYPDGTTLLVWSPDTRASLVLRVNNAGPYWGDRKLDVSRRAAEVLGFAAQGVATLKIRVIDAPSVEEATYKKNRTYDPVPGYIGAFASLDEAQAGAATAYMVAGLASPFATTVALAATATSGSTGTQSGAAAVAPTVLAAAERTPSTFVWPVVSEPARTATPVKVAGYVQVAEASVDTLERAPRAVAAKHKPAARKRSQPERAALRNSRSYRVAAQQRRKQDVARTRLPVAVAAARAPEGKRPITQDGTNDMSIFSRHVYAGMERLAAEEPRRRKPAYSSAGRYAMRDDNEG